MADDYIVINEDMQVSPCTEEDEKAQAEFIEELDALMKKYIDPDRIVPFQFAMLLSQKVGYLLLMSDVDFDRAMELLAFNMGFAFDYQGEGSA